MPFDFGNCPLCGGDGYKETEVTDSIRLRIYWNRADWIRIAGSIVADDADIMVIGYMADVRKVNQAAHLILVSDNTDASHRAALAGKPVPWGFGRDRYFVAYLKGV
jgi:hypothetical protein